jgi:SAM-dependent methyltransferase
VLEPSALSGSRGARAGKFGYGIDEPRSIIELVIAGILAAAIGFVLSDYIVLSGFNQQMARISLLAGPAVGFLILAVASALYWSSHQGKVAEMARLVSDLPWGGNEVVLDLGCGRGLGMVLAGKRLSGGYVVGVDVWKSAHLSGNNPSSIWANASSEGVADRVVPMKGDAGSLPLADASVDVVLSALSLHRLIRKRDRVTAFREIARVLKEGGRIGILDSGSGPEYSKVLREIGMSDITVRRLRFSSFPPFHVVIARKPFQG